MGGCDILVTGAGGFVGGHVLELARRNGRTALASEGDLRQAVTAEQAVRDAQPRAILHLAGAPRASDSWLGLLDELAMSGALLRAVARWAPGAPMLVAGSAAQYGMGERRPLTEADATVPVSSYGAAKCVLEQAVTGPLRGSVRVIFARSFNHIGPGQRTDAPAAQWAREAVEAETAGGGTIRTGDLEVVRDFLDVRDIADAYLSLVDSPASGAVNVCSGVPVSVRHVAEAVVERCAVPLSIAHDATLDRGLDPPYVVGDPTRLHELTGWSPRIPLGRSIDDLLDASRRDVARSADAPALAQ